MRFTKKTIAQTQQTVRIVFENRGTQAKTFDVSAEYSKPIDTVSARVSDAVANNVTVTTSSASVTVAAGEETNVTATVNIPASAEMGQYEGYVNIVNHDNPNEHYRIPFATRFVEKGIEDVEVLESSNHNAALETSMDGTSNSLYHIQIKQPDERFMADYL